MNIRDRQRSLITTLMATLMAVGICAVPTAKAHIVFEQPQASAGTYYKATMRVSHGCSGAATTGITLHVPAGFQGAKPQPKAGWVTTTHKTKLAQPYVSHGKTVTEDVTQISWKATNAQAALPDDFYDEFAWMVRLPDTPGQVWVRVVQTCTQGSNDWAEVPATGTSTQGLKTPALLLIIDAAGAAHHSY